MKQRIETIFGTTKIYRPGTLENQKTALVVPGYSESITHNKQLVDALVAQGVDAFTFDQPRKRGPRTLAPIERQGAVVLRVLESTLSSETSVHAVAHSLGSAAVLKAAAQAPERFASLTLMQPVGMVGQQGFPELLGRVGKKVVKNQLGALTAQDPQRSAKAGYAAFSDTEPAAHYSNRVNFAQTVSSLLLARQPSLAVQEAGAAGSYDIAHDLANVAKLGVPIHIVTAHSDEMFDAEKVDAAYPAIANFVDSYSSIADRSARHDTFWMQPQRTAQIVSQYLL